MLARNGAQETRLRRSGRNSFGHDMNIDFDMAINAVFRLLDRHISQGESIQVRNSMKKSLRQLWPAH
jgi:uncharacterized protein (DUF2267 family)